MKFYPALVVGAIVVLDQLTKSWAVVQDKAQINTGIAFGWWSSGSTLLIALIVLALAIWWVSAAKDKQRLRWVGSIVLGGAVSNVLDRARWGGVVDWLPVPFTQLTNNLADYAIVIGLCLLFYVHNKDQNHHT